jgi:hypothetical protein
MVGNEWQIAFLRQQLLRKEYYLLEVYVSQGR